MQTFLPYEDFSKSAAVLDRQRLGKQRVETLQIAKAVISSEYGWQQHPCVKMWRGYAGALMQYQRAICAEWTGRGYKDTCLDKTAAIIGDQPLILPPWLGDPDFHLSHQSNLLRKLPEHYQQFFPGVASDLEYIWPGAVAIA